MYDTLIDLFNNLAKPEISAASSLHFSACPLPERSNDYLAKDINDQPTFLISGSRNTVERTPPPISLEHLHIDYGLECILKKIDGTRFRGFFSVIRCLDADRILKEYFLRSVPPVLLSLPANPSYAEISSAVRSLAELFRLILSPGRKSIQGLWAELFLINRSLNPSYLIESWHSVPEDRYDFNAGSERIEVKSTAGEIRMHHFSLEQLHPPPGTEVIIVSIFVESSGGGLNVFDLVENIRARVNFQRRLVSKIDQIVATLIGSGWRRAVDMRFDLEFAEESLSFYQASTIPSPEYPPPAAVSQVHFVADISSMQRLQITAEIFKMPLFQCLLA